MCDLSSDSSDVIDGLEQIFKDKVSAADQAITSLTRLQGAFNTDMDKTTDELDKHHHEVIKQLQQQHRSFRKQLQERRYQVNQDLDISKALLGQSKDCIKRLQNQSESWRLPIPAVPDTMLTGIEDLIADITKQMPSTDVPVNRTTRLVFVPTDRLSLGEITKQSSRSQGPEGK
jgi:small-conductance mechanosensitive channel